MDLDTHVVIYNDIKIETLKSKLDSQLKTDGLKCEYKLSTVKESKHKPRPFIILTSDSNSFEELKESHFNFCSVFKELQIETLFESEDNYDISALFKETFDNTKDFEINESLDNLDRISMSEKHWGDIHLDIPARPDTIKIRNIFDELGFSFIVTEKNNIEKAVITVQIINKDLLEPVIGLMCKVLKKESFKADSFVIKAEKLIHFDATFDAKPLPLTIGLKTSQHA